MFDYGSIFQQGGLGTELWTAPDALQKLENKMPRVASPIKSQELGHKNVIQFVAGDRRKS